MRFLRKNIFAVAFLALALGGLGTFSYLPSSQVKAAPIVAADADLRVAFDTPWQVLDVATSGTTLVVLPNNDIQIVHLGYQTDGSTASATTDYIVVMRKYDKAGAAVTMAANLNTGIKLPIFQGGSAVIRAGDIPEGPDGPREIQIQASGNGAKVLIIRGVGSK